MNPLEFITSLGKKTPKPAELVEVTVNALREVASASDPMACTKAIEMLSGSVQSMKYVLYGAPDGGAVDAEQAQQLAATICETDLIRLLVFHLQYLEFECRKDVAQVVSSMLRKTSGPRLPTVELFAADASLISTLLGGYDLPPIALSCGLMLREATRHEQLARQLLYLPDFFRLFEHIESAYFEVASDAFTTFKDVLTKHKQLVAEFLVAEYTTFFGAYSKLITSSNYVTKRQSLKLLSELLLDRANFKVMTQYISSADDFKLIMLLLRDNSKIVQYEAFHVFKIFVANPNRPKPIVDIIVRNEEKLIAFLTKFQADKDDEQFADEKAFLIAEVQNVCAAATAAAAGAGAGAAGSRAECGAAGSDACAAVPGGAAGADLGEPSDTSDVPALIPRTGGIR